MRKYLTFIQSTLFFFSIFFSVPGLATANDISAILYDYNTGQILYEKNADEGHYPASLTKMMTLYLTFQALSKEGIGFNSQFPVSYNASIQEPSKLGLLPGQYVSTYNLILGVATNSSNDAATVLAEGLGGNVPTFSTMMNNKAEQLGMLNSYFENPTGLPNPNQTTTARDVLRLAIALHRDFPQYCSIFNTHYFDYRGRQYKNHNHLLNTCEGVDGIKTGYIRAAGYNLAGSATRNGRRLLAVVLGGKTAQMRDRLMCNLFDYGFDGATNFEEVLTPLMAANIYSNPYKKAVSTSHKTKTHKSQSIKKSKHKATHHTKKSASHALKKKKALSKHHS